MYHNYQEKITPYHEFPSESCKVQPVDILSVSLNCLLNNGVTRSSIIREAHLVSPEHIHVLADDGGRVAIPLPRDVSGDLRPWPSVGLAAECEEEVTRGLVIAASKQVTRGSLENIVHDTDLHRCHNHSLSHPGHHCVSVSLERPLPEFRLLFRLGHLTPPEGVGVEDKHVYGLLIPVVVSGAVTSKWVDSVLHSHSCVVNTTRPSLSVFIWSRTYSDSEFFFNLHQHGLSTSWSPAPPDNFDINFAAVV